MAVAWDLDFHQLSKNYLETGLDQIQAGNILFSHLACGCFSTHAGQTPENMYSICLPDAGCPEFRYFDHHIDQPVLLVATPGQAFDIVARPGYGIVTFSIPKPFVHQYLETHPDAPWDSLRDYDQGVVPVSPDIATDLRIMAVQLLGLARLAPDSAGPTHPLQSIESRLLELLFDALEREGAKRNEPGARERSRVLRHVREFAKSHEHEPLKVRDLAAAANTSERTLERIFKREVGTSPKQYLFGERMYGAHRQLWRADPHETSVADVANAWGFWHMGQFAKDHRRMFGKLPSETLNTSGFRPH